MTPAIPKPAHGFSLDAFPAQAARWHSRRWLPIGIAIVTLFGVAAWVGAQPPEVASDELRFGTVRQGPIALGVSAYGSLVPARLLAVSTSTGGTVARVPALPGTRVTKGEILLVLDNPELSHELRLARQAFAGRQAQIAVIRAKALDDRSEIASQWAESRDDLAISRLEVEAFGRLADDGIVSRLEYRKTEARTASLVRRSRDLQASLARHDKAHQTLANAQQVEIAALQADVDRLSNAVDQLTLRAPAAGIVHELSTEVRLVGGSVPPGSLVARVSPHGALAAELVIAAPSASSVTPGQLVLLEHGGHKLEGRVSLVGTQAVRNEVTIRVSLPDEVPDGLLAGEPVVGRIISHQYADGLSVARPAEARDGRSGAVHVVRGDELVRVPVRFGAGDDASIVVTSGLHAGDRIVLNDLGDARTSSRINLDGLH